MTYPAEADDHDFVRFRRGLAVQRRIQAALVTRILLMKYGRRNIGFLWLVLEPMILCSGVLVTRSFISGREENGLSLIAILVTGYLPLTLWRHITNSGVFLLRRYGPMLYHRDISLLDCAFATVVLEIGGCTLAAVIVYWTLFTLQLIEPVYDIGLLLEGWLMMAMLAMGLMMIFAVLTELYDATERFIQPFQYLMIPLCGFFFMVGWLPTSVQKLAWYVPTIHCYEMIRAGLFGPSVTTHFTWWYPLVWAIAMLAYAIPKVDEAREKLHVG